MPDTRDGPPGRHAPPGDRSTRTQPAKAEVMSSVQPGHIVAALLALSDERDAWLRRVLAAWREGYQAALDDAVVASLLRIWPEPGHIPEIDKRRYPPGGRESWIIPRPGEADGGQRS